MVIYYPHHTTHYTSVNRSPIQYSAALNAAAHYLIFFKALEDYKGYLNDRGYSDKVINKTEMKLATVSREQLRKVEPADVDVAENKTPKKSPSLPTCNEV